VKEVNGCDKNKERKTVEKFGPGGLKEQWGGVGMEITAKYAT
jgi:hypothetical protein